MEYAPANIAAPGETQGEFYGSVPGPFDFWRVEYGYRDFGAETPDEELEELQKIASRSGDPLLVYATDFDRMGSAVDPYVNVFDLGDDPLAYCEHKIKLTRELWDNSIKKFEKPGVSYEKISRVVRAGWRSYMESAMFAARYIGGLHHGKSYVGDEGGGLPFKPVSGAEQKRAIAFLNDYVFAAEAFKIDPNLLNKMQSVQTEDFTGSMYRGAIAYPWHEMVLATQSRALRILYSRQTIGRLLNNVDRAGNEYTMYDMFTDVRRSIWSEITGPSNVNSHRRQLQLAHLTWVSAIYLSGSAQYPSDARTLAANDLDIIEGAARTATNASIDEMSRAHYKEVIRQIEATKGAQKTYSKLR
jgi:hypothetical protein